MTGNTDEAALTDRILQAALPHVPFDGWSDAVLAAAVADSGEAPALARAFYPRGGLDLALAYHAAGDRAMLAALAAEDLGALRFRDRVARAVWLRLGTADRELVRRGTTLFSLPQNAAAGAGAIWGTADAIWAALGDTSDDVNWYTKRATLSAVYGATVLFWLGDDSTDHQATQHFLDRRIAGVMAFEAAKARFAANPLGKALLAGPLKALDRIRAPRMRRDLPADLPGRDAGPRAF